MGKYLLIVAMFLLIAPQTAHAGGYQYKSKYKKPYYSKTYKKSYKRVSYNYRGAYCSCVTFAKQASGINVGSIGLARNHPINSQEPTPGSIVVTAESRSGHVAVVTAVNGNMITLSEANYRPCQKSSRTISKHSGFIRGYYVR